MRLDDDTSQAKSIWVGSLFAFALPRCGSWLDLLGWGSPFAFALPRLWRLARLARQHVVLPRGTLSHSLPVALPPDPCQGAYPLDPAPLRG